MREDSSQNVAPGDIVLKSMQCKNYVISGLSGPLEGYPLSAG